MSQVAELRLAPFGLPEQPGIRIRCGSMGLVLPLLPVKIDLSSRSRRFALAILPPETLLTRPSLDQYPVHGEMFIRHVRFRTFQHPLEKSLRDLLVQQTLPILTEHRVIPYRLVHLHPHEPPEQQAVIEFLCQSSLNET